MSKIFEALLNAGISARELDEAADPAHHLTARTGSHMFGKASRVNMGEEMARLHRELDARLADTTHPVIQFIGSRRSEGTTTVVQEFARVSAALFGERVLLLELDRRQPTRVVHVLGGELPIEIVASQIGNTNVFTAPFPQSIVDATRATDSLATAMLWDRLRRDYDLVLVDSPAAEASAEGLAISNRVDGVVLVLAAEKTRWPVAERVKETIERNGGRVLGIVFNKRRYHIPAFLYRLL